MIEVTRDGCKITIHVSPGGSSGNWRFGFSFTSEAEWAAVLLENVLRDGIREFMRATRKNAYRAGYKHGRAKQGRVEFFSGNYGSSDF